MLFMKVYATPSGAREAAEAGYGTAGRRRNYNKNRNTQQRNAISRSYAGAANNRARAQVQRARQANPRSRWL